MAYLNAFLLKKKAGLILPLIFEFISKLSYKLITRVLSYNSLTLVNSNYRNWK